MIRIVQRRLIIPQGDTGSFTLPLLQTAQEGNKVKLTIYDPLHKQVVLTKEVDIQSENAESRNVTFDFIHEDTMDIEPSNKYQWDVKIIDENNSTIDSYYSAFQLPICEIRVAP